MEKITFKRLLRWTLASLIVVIAIAYGFGVGIASAETGTVTLDDIATKTGYSFGAGGADTYGTGVSVKYIRVANTQYNTILTATVYIQTAGRVAFTKTYNSDTFTITGGGSGSGSLSYNATDRRIYYYFNDDVIFTGTALTLTFANNINNEITFDQGYAGSSNVDVNKPFCIGANDGQCFGHDSNAGGASILYNTNVAVTTSVSYVSTYPIFSGTQYFNLAITKLDSISNRAAAEGVVSIYCNPPYDTTSYSCLAPYVDGLYLNLSLSGGAYIKQVINSTGLPSVPTPTINPITHGGILWDKTNYSKNEIGTVTYLFDAGLFEDWFSHWIDIEKNGVFVQKYEGLGVSGNIQYQFGSTGTYTAKYYKCLFLTCLLPSLIDSASVSVSVSQSYIYVNSTVPTNYPVNVSYRLGYAPVMQLPTNGIEVRQVSSGRLTNVCYNNNIVANTLYNCSITFPADGQYKIILREIGAGDVVSVYTMAIQQYNPPQENVSISSISTDRSSYFIGDNMRINFEIDSTNYSNFLTYYAFYNTTTGKNVANHKLNGQQVGMVENILGTYLDSWDYTRFISSSGNYNISLRAKNNSVDFGLASQNFSFTNANRRGISMSLKSKSICTKESIMVTYTISEPVNLTIQESYSGKILAVYLLNESGTLNYKISKTGIYLISLQAVSDNSIQALDDVTITEICGIEGGTGTNISGWTSVDTTNSCGFWDGWVANLAGGQGVNDLTRFMFALVIIGMITAFTAIITKNLGAGIITGFFPYAFFVFISLSTPCGQYMPVWTAIFIALIVGIKMRWFN